MDKWKKIWDNAYFKDSVAGSDEIQDIYTLGQIGARLSDYGISNEVAFEMMGLNNGVPLEVDYTNPAYPMVVRGKGVEIIRANRCRYCGRRGDGDECRGCGAPL